METKLRPVADVIVTIYPTEINICGLTTKGKEIRLATQKWSEEHDMPFITRLGARNQVVKFYGFNRRQVVASLKQLLRKHKVTCRITVVDSNKRKRHLLTFFYRCLP
jgi:hypothetical protein